MRKEIAEKWFQSKPTQSKISAIDDVLEPCLPRGMGYFEVKGAKPRRWRAIEFDSYEKISAEIAQLRRLRERMIEVEETEDEEGNLIAQNIPIAPKVWSSLRKVEFRAPIKLFHLLGHS